MSRELIQRTEPELLPELYPQTSDKKSIDQIMQRTEESHREIEETLLVLIQEQGYATEKQVVETIGKRTEGNIPTEAQLKHSLSDLMNAYDLVKIRANKQYKAKFKIDLPPKKSPVIIIRKESMI